MPLHLNIPTGKSVRFFSAYFFEILPNTFAGQYYLRMVPPSHELVFFYVNLSVSVKVRSYCRRTTNISGMTEANTKIDCE